MSNELISIIIPVYNIAPYLRRCLDSIISQTYKNLEILIINDGSTDGSLSIIEDYARSDSRIRIITQKNAGLSAARNSGLKAAKGSYVAFVDGDDSVFPSYVSELVTTIKSTKSDIAVCGYTPVFDKGPGTPIIPQTETISGENATIRLLTRQENIDIVAWNKLYRIELFKKHDILYPVGMPHEDSLTTYKLYTAATKVAYCSTPLYNYYQRSGSIMNKASELDRLSYRELAANEAVSYFSKSKSLKSAAEVSLLLAHFAYLDASLKGEISKSYTKKSLSWITSHASSFKANPHLTRKLRLYLCMVTHFNSRPYMFFRKITLR